MSFATLARRLHGREFALFCLVGSSGYAVNLVIFATAYVGGAGHVPAATLAFVLAATSNYLLNRRWTFTGAAATAMRIQAPRFFAVSVATLAVNLALLHALVDIAGVRAVVAQALAVILATPLSFAGQKRWSFGPAPAWKVATAKGSTR